MPGCRSLPPLYHIPKRTLILQPRLPRPFWWHMGSSGGQPAMQIVGRLTATNISKYGVLVTSAKMRKPRATGHVLVRSPENNLFGSSYLIESRYITEMHFSFWVAPPVRKKGEAFLADIAIVDQFGNEHWMKKLKFEYS